VRSGVMVQNGVDQSGLDLTQLAAGDLQQVSIDLGSPPSGLTAAQAEVGIELGQDEVLQLPDFQAASSLLVPKATALAAGATYRLTAVAQSSAQTLPSQSAVIVHGMTGTSLAVAGWLPPPTGVAASRIGVSYQPVSGAQLHQISFADANGVVLFEGTIFDPTLGSLSIPSWLSLPQTGTLTAKVSGIAVSFDIKNFSLDRDRDKLLGFAAQPVDVP